MSRPAHPFPVLPPTPEDENNMAEPDILSKPSPFVVTQPVPGGQGQPAVIDTPTSPFSSFALSRFEFEEGKGNEGTKILMVEWDVSSTLPSADTSAGPGAPGAAQGGPGAGSADKSSGRTVESESDDWVVSWEGKTNSNVVAVRDTTSAAANGSTKRMYFLLPPGVHIPALVAITPKRATPRRATTTTTTTTAATARTKPGETSETVDAAPSKSTEKSGAGHTSDATNTANANTITTATTTTTTTTTTTDDDGVLRTKPMPAIFPASLGSDSKDAGLRGVLHTIWAKQRLADLEAEIEAEMKANSESIGLQIAIQEHEWIIEHFGVGTPLGPQTSQPQLPDPLSPPARATPRPAVGGKLGEKLRGLKLATSPADLAAASQASKAAAIATRSAQAAPAGPRGSTKAAFFHPQAAPYTSIDPPAGIHNSLDAVVRGEHGAPAGTLPGEAVDGEDELFALPMSPRSPEMAKSPFSFL